MKKQVTVEREYCDICTAKADYAGHCLGCGKAFCHECEKTHAIAYSHGCFVGGSGDGLYCRECDQLLSAAKDPLHSAYLVIRSLRNESKGFEEDWGARRKVAEEHLKQLQADLP